MDTKVQNNMALIWSTDIIFLNPTYWVNLGSSM